MNTYPLHTRDGERFGFEIENIYISVRKVAALLRSVPGVEEVLIRKLFSHTNPEIHISFTFMGKPFMVWEPYGDSSRYCICPNFDEKEKIIIDVSALESVFQQYRPPLAIKVFGDLVSLKFLAPLKPLFKSSPQK